MRDCLSNVAWSSSGHAGLTYDVWAPVNFDDCKIDLDQRDDWLEDLSKTAIPAGYESSYQIWSAGLKDDDETCWTEVTLASRLLLGHGNSAPTEVGLTLHHTWGVPVLPGSSLKGLLAHYIDAVYGGDEPERQPFRGVTWDGNRIVRGPGAAYRAIFGAPDADDDPRDCPGAAQGGLIFHDALWIPEGKCLPLAPDVLTVHQQQYYRTQGQHWPNDYDSPIPVSFLTVKPGARFLVATSGPRAWAALALEQLVAALIEWGVGGKTAAGYGRIKPGVAIHIPPIHPCPEVAAFVAALGGQFENANARLTWVEGALEPLLALEVAQRDLARQAIKEMVGRHPKTRDRLDAIDLRLEKGPVDPAIQAFLTDLEALPATEDGIYQILDLASRQAAAAVDAAAVEQAIRDHFTAPALQGELEAFLKLLADG